VSPPATTTQQVVRRPRGVLGERAFRLLWVGETTSALGANVSLVALPLIAVVTLHATAFQVSVLTAAAWLPWLVLGLPAGAWVDRAPLRPLMLVCNGICALALVSVPLVARTATLALWQLLTVALVTGSAAVFFQTAMQVYLPTVITQHNLPAANAGLQGSESVAEVAGPSVAGLITQTLGAVVAPVADAASFLVSSACLVLIGKSAQQAARTDPATPAEGLGRQIAAGLQFIRSDPYLRVLTVFGAASNIALIGYQTLLVVFLIRDVGVSPAGVGLLLSGMSVGGVIGAAISGPLGRRLGTARTMLVSQLAGAPFSLLVPLTGPGPRLALVLVGGIGVGAGVVSSNVIGGTFRQTYCPRALLGRVTTGMRFLNYGSIPLGALLAGVLSHALGVRPTLWIMTVAVVLASFLLLLGPIRHHRDLPAAP
jgi:MFS family permease